MKDARMESSSSEDGEDSDHDPGEEESEVQGSDEEPTVDLSTYQVLKSDGHDNVLAFNEPGGYALWLHKSDVPDAALTGRGFGATNGTDSGGSRCKSV